MDVQATYPNVNVNMNHILVLCLTCAMEQFEAVLKTKGIQSGF